MELIEVFKFIRALTIGISSGIIGGGGSILALPVLANYSQLIKKAVTAYSLFIVVASA